MQFLPCNVVFLAMLFSLHCCFPCNVVFLAFFPFVMLLSLQCCFPCNVVFVAFCFPFVMLLFLQCCFPFALYKIDHTWCALDQVDTKSRFKFSDNKLGRGALGPRRSKSGCPAEICISDLEPSIQPFGQLSFVWPLYFGFGT